MNLTTAGKFWIGYFTFFIAALLFSTILDVYQIWTSLGAVIGAVIGRF